VTDFVRRQHRDSDAVQGARWWNESFAAFRRQPRRSFLGLAIGGGVAAVWGGAALVEALRRDDGVERSFDALALQRREGWNVGYPERPLSMTGAVDLDAEQGAGWRTSPQSLAEQLTPDEPLRPYASPTLFQALAEPSSGTLRAQLRPTHTAEMDDAFRRGQALLALTRQPDAPGDVAVIIDLPGPQSVAVAAALAPRFAPVFTFDNWPHPLGVVPSHLTLAACLYYLPLFSSARRTRPAPAPPVFVLDANRLAPYRDAATQFDNRYVAPLPSAEALRRLGVARVLYVRPDESSLTELDDLNADFVAMHGAGLEVRALALSDFTTVVTGAAPAMVYGSAHYHPLFWRSYGWSAVTWPRREPLPPSRALSYRPLPRTTLFASRVVGGSKPAGFGRVSVRLDGDGRLASYGTTHRSGSFGRSRSSWSG
jgi:hypothetical protein